MSKKQRGLFDEQDKLERISKLGDPLEKLNASIEWPLFRPVLNNALRKEAQGPGGRPPFDYVMMFKILVLQEYFGLSDEQAEFQITDRLSFMRFLGLHIWDKVPDCKTIWHFREQLKEGDIIKKLFNIFHEELSRIGMIVNKGKIIDASIIEVPVQRNSRDENRQIKEGEVPKDWKKNPDKLSHKDVEARWVTKYREDQYGYKNSIKVDARKKFIDDYTVTDAAVHDSIPGKTLLNKKDRDQRLHGDGAYAGEEFANEVSRCGMINMIHEKGCRHRPLTDRQKQSNKRKSKVRVRVEHIFGFMRQVTGNVIIRTIGMTRAKVKIGIMNLTYNLFRYAFYYKPSRA